MLIGLFVHRHLPTGNGISTILVSSQKGKWHDQFCTCDTCNVYQHTYRQLAFCSKSVILILSARRHALSLAPATQFARPLQQALVFMQCLQALIVRSICVTQDGPSNMLLLNETWYSSIDQVVGQELPRCHQITVTNAHFHSKLCRK